VLDQSEASAVRVRGLVRLVVAGRFEDAQAEMSDMVDGPAAGFLLLMTLAQGIVRPYLDSPVYEVMPASPIDPEVEVDPRVLESAKFARLVVQNLVDGREDLAAMGCSAVAQEGPLPTAFLAAQFLHSLAQQAREGVQSFEEVRS